MDILNTTGSILLGTTKMFKGVPPITFSWYDYLFFVIMLASSAIIGIYFGCFGSKQSTKNEYLLAGKTMKPLPVALSLVASNVSGTALLGIPSDIYRFGITYALCTVAVIAVAVITLKVYLPVFYELQMTSAYEYLNVRFDSKIRSLASFFFLSSVLLHLPITIYVPALAFAKATNIAIYYVIPLVCTVCIFYTTIGGLKAVIWTDTLQLLVTVVAMGAIFYLGIVSAGGMTNVFEKAYEGSRLDIDFDWLPTKRDTFWAMIIGWTSGCIAFMSVSQSNIQKFLSVPTYNQAKRAFIMYIVGMVMVKLVCIITGLIMFAKYFECDPFSTGQLKHLDELLPHYVMDVAGSIPGLPGLFIAGIFCAGLSTLSAYLNCMAGVLYEDFVSQYLTKDTDPKRVNNILKLIVVCIGVTSTGLAFLVEHLGGLLQLTIAMSSVYSGPSLGLFTLGMLIPKANKMGALYGGIFSSIFMFSTFGFNQWYKYKGLTGNSPKPVYTYGCNFDFVPTSNSTILDKPEDVFFLFRISHYYYTLMGVLLVLIVGYPISLLTRKNDDPLPDRKLLSPVVRFMVNTKSDNVDYYSVEKAMNMVSSTENEREKDCPNNV